jgi:hypothetical protein
MELFLCLNIVVGLIPKHHKCQLITFKMSSSEMIMVSFYVDDLWLILLIDLISDFDFLKHYDALT